MKKKTTLIERCQEFAEKELPGAAFQKTESMILIAQDGGQTLYASGATPDQKKTLLLYLLGEEEDVFKEIIRDRLGESLPESDDDSAQDSETVENNNQQTQQEDENVQTGAC